MFASLYGRRSPGPSRVCEEWQGMAVSDWDNGGTVRLRVLERPGGWAPTDGLVGSGTGHGSGLSRSVW